MANEMTAREIFAESVNFFKGKYPDRKIKLKPDGCVSIDGTVLFNSEGYNLLYNLKRLVDALQNELQ